MRLETETEKKFSGFRKISVSNLCLNSECAFTLIEFLVVVAIIIIIAILVLVNYRGGERRYSLEGAAQELITHLRRAQNMALTGVTYGGTVPAGGYGVHFDTHTPDSYILFADNDEDYFYDSGEEIETIKLSSKIRLSGLNPASPLDIVFVPPDPQTKINGGTNPATITLQEQATGQTKSVTVSSQGVIE